MPRVLFIYLQAFSHTGGIEKFNRSFLKALYELSIDERIDADAYSLYDSSCNYLYFSENRFRGFAAKKLWFVLQTIFHALKYDVLIVGHINLAVVGLIVKKIKPSIKVVTIVHGIDIWDEQQGLKKKFMNEVDCFLAVSSFTKSKMLENNSYLIADKIKVFPNTIDPYFNLPNNFEKPEYLLQRYDVKPNEKIILTVTRLASTEKYKGYDHVFKVLKSINAKTNFKVRYFLGGKADALEAKRIDELIKENDVAEYVQLLGFIKDEELIDHYLLADVFAMPSKKEGFGIVFIEAMACGLKVIAGNKDGSVDALKNGELGILINPDSETELEEAILISLMSEEINDFDIQKKVMSAFGFETYKNRLQKILALESGTTKN